MSKTLPDRKQDEAAVV